MKKIFPLTFLTIFLSYLSVGAHAKVTFKHKLIFDVDFSDQYQNTNRKEEHRDTFVDGRLYSSLNFNENLSLNSKIKLLRVDEKSEGTRRSSRDIGGGDRTFENQALYVEQLYLKYTTNKYEIRAGEFNLNYGKAWKWGRGIWNHEIAENYKQKEKVGFRASYNMGDKKKNGKYTFGIAMFKNDHKYLENTLITKRNNPAKSAGKPGDARLYESYKASLDVEFDFGKREKLYYHFAQINLAVNERFSPKTATKIDDQKGYVLGMGYKKPIRKNFDLDWILEYAKMKNLNGDSDVTENYVTANIIARLYKNWNVTLGYSGRYQKEIDANGIDEDLNEISFGYDFDKSGYFDKLTLQAGYRRIRLDQKTSLNESDTFGILLRYYKYF